MTGEIPENGNTADMVIKRYDELRKVDPDNPLLSWVRILNGGRVMIKTPDRFYERFNPGHNDTYRIELLNYSKALEDTLKEKE